MLSNLSRRDYDKINLISGLGICGIFLLGPLSYLSIANIFLQSIIAGNFYFDPAVTAISNISMTVNLVYLFALAGGVPGLIIGLAVGKFSGKKVLGMELGLVTGMSILPIQTFNSISLEMLLYSLGGLLVGLLGCYLGRKVGRFAGKVLLQKIISKNIN
jgi:hypothetical protein